MLNYFQRLKNRKGFTIIELIVVIGVIAVLAGITIPMSMGAGLVRDAVSKAKNFYFSLQNVMVDYRSMGETEPFFTITNPAPETPAVPRALGENGYLYIEGVALKGTGLTTVNVAVCNPATGTTIDTTRAYGVAMTNKMTDDKLKEQLVDFFSDDDYGYFYALVDSKCRVVETYWCSIPFYEISDAISFTNPAPISFTENDKIGNIIVGAYPENRSTKEVDMFMIV